MQLSPVSLRRSFLLLVLPLVLSFTASAQKNYIQPRITQAVDETNLTLLKGNTHPLARPEFDRGPAPPNLPMERMLLILTRSTEQEAALEQLLEQQQDKSSPNYHKWLTPEQFGLQFGPTDADIQTITSWLQSHGFQVAHVARGRTVIEFSGTASQVKEAFHAEIHKFIVHGEEHWANASDPQVPAALAPVVAGLDSLHNFPKKPMHHLAGTFSRSKETGKVKPVSPLFTFPGGCDLDGNCYALGPYDFATIYDVLPLWNATAPAPVIDGTGQTIAIVGETNINVQDVRDFRNFFGLSPNDPQIILDGPDPGIQPDETEADLDVEWSGAVAKNATIKLVVSASTETTAGIDLSAEYIVDSNLAPVMSESYGECELNLGTSSNQFYNQLWQQAAAQGITVFIASGDSGSAGCDNDNAFPPAPARFGLQISGIASTPNNVAVGGTDFNDFFNPTTYWNTTNSTDGHLASAKGYIPETTWNDTCTNAIFGDPRIGFSTNAETNCNNPQLVFFVSTLGGGGGKSNCTTPTGQTPSSCAGGYAKPSWQTGAGVPSDGKRDIPDVSLFASNGFLGNFYVMCEVDLLPPGSTSCNPTDPNTYFIGVGGTSASTPALAGIMALVNQKTVARQGNANFVFYKFAAQTGKSCTSAANPSTSCVFFDVPSGSTIAMPCATGSTDCKTSTSGHQYGILTGYGTTTGYDLATGLGSVNAANLVNGWGNVAGTFKASTTTLTLSPTTNITHGSAVNVSISAAATPPATGTPTGQVSLLTSNNQAVQDFTLGSSGTVSSSTKLLPGGTYTVTAHYAGDGTFGASDSFPTSVTVNPEPSKTQVGIVTFDLNTGQIASTNATSVPFGSPYLLRVNITGSSGATCAQNGLGDAGCPTGTVALTDNGNPLDGDDPLGSGTYRLNSQGYAEDQAIQLPVGSHSLAAAYSGDNSFNKSSSTDAVTVTKASTTIGVTASPAIIISGDSVTLTATVNTQSNATTPSGLPTGSVQFLLGTTNLGSVAVTGSVNLNTGFAQATASFMTSTLPIGHDSITAQYSGDSNYSASTSPATTVSVLIGTTTTVTSSSPMIQQGQSVTFTVQVTPNQNGGPALTGTVQFQVNSTNTGSPVTLSSNGQAQLTTTSLAAGTPVIQANYSGDSNYASSSGSTPEQVSGFTITANPGTVIIASPGSSGTATLTVNVFNGFTGSVTFTPTSCSGLPTESSCSFNPSSVAAGGTTTLSIRTTAPSLVLPDESPHGPGRWMTYGRITLVSCLLIVLLVLALRRSTRRRSIAVTLLVLTFMAVNAACGGGGGNHNPGTPAPSTSTVTITGTSGGTTSATTITVSVQ